MTTWRESPAGSAAVGVDLAAGGEPGCPRQVPIVRAGPADIETLGLVSTLGYIDESAAPRDRVSASPSGMGSAPLIIRSSRACTVAAALIAGDRWPARGRSRTVRSIARSTSIPACGTRWPTTPRVSASTMRMRPRRPIAAVLQAEARKVARVDVDANHGAQIAFYATPGAERVHPPEPVVTVPSVHAGCNRIGVLFAVLQLAKLSIIGGRSTSTSSPALCKLGLPTAGIVIAIRGYRFAQSAGGRMGEPYPQFAQARNSHASTYAELSTCSPRGTPRDCTACRNDAANRTVSSANPTGARGSAGNDRR